MDQLISLELDENIEYFLTNIPNFSTETKKNNYHFCVPDANVIMACRFQHESSRKGILRGKVTKFTSYNMFIIEVLEIY